MPFNITFIWLAFALNVPPRTLPDFMEINCLLCNDLLIMCWSMLSYVFNVAYNLKIGTYYKEGINMYQWSLNLKSISFTYT